MVRLKSFLFVSFVGAVLALDSVASPALAAGETSGAAAAAKPRATVGAYYFEGWAGQHRLAPKASWAKGQPTHMTRRLLTEFSGREPLWGWRADTPAIMERQIDLAADHALDFFAFCWYWHADPAATAADPKNTCIERFVKASNNSRMHFALLVANHAPYELKDLAAWRTAITAWMPYLTHPRYLRVGGKPLLILFKGAKTDPAGIALLQESARKAGLPGVAVALCGSGPASLYGFTTRYNANGGYQKGSERHDYAELMASHKRTWTGSPAQPHIPCLSVGFDRRPWEEGAAARCSWYYTGGTPERFAAGVREALAWMDAHPQQAAAERLMILYAWNELGEGGYLVPTKDDPQAKYLQALRDVVQPAPPSH